MATRSSSDKRTASRVGASSSSSNDDPPPKPKRIRIPTDERRQQNRLAQRNHRDKKDRQLAELQDEVQELRQKNATLEVQVQELRRIIHTSMRGRSSPTSPPTFIDSSPRIPRPPSSSSSRAIPNVPASDETGTTHQQVTTDSHTTLPIAPGDAQASTEAQQGTFVPAPAPSNPTLPSRAFPEPSLGAMDTNTDLPWLSDFLASLTQNSHPQPVADPVPVAGLWQTLLPAPYAEPEPYSLAGLDMVFGWDSGNISPARPDNAHLFDSLKRR